jgi:hypothetical protein
MAGVFLKMRARFAANDVPIQIWGTEEEAIEWVRSILDSTP